MRCLQTSEWSMDQSCPGPRSDGAEVGGAEAHLGAPKEYCGEAKIAGSLADPKWLGKGKPSLKKGRLPPGASRPREVFLAHYSGC